MKLLLINPKFPESFWSFSWALKNVTRDKKTTNSPLGLATLAALTPEDWEIQIIDENIEPIDWSLKADIVGVCGMGVQVERQKEILSHFKRQGIFVVAGGSYASLCPEVYAGLADSIISGEAEYIWPQFCRDYLAGNPQALYQEKGNVNLHDSPCPRFDLLKLDCYQRVSMQFSRGCPFLCEFCDIIVMFGRTPRNKSTAQIEKELDGLRKLGVTQLFFVDDNFIGNKKLAKELLQFLADYQVRHQYRFSFGTEASLNLADDPELLQLFQRANFEWVFIGIESPSEESLKETKKVQNMKGDLLGKIQKIYSAGLDIMGGFIVGFDSDDKTIFERQFQFIEASGIIVSMVGLLSAMPKTPLYQRLQAEGRLKSSVSMDNTRVFTNIIPKQMTDEELIRGYVGLHRRLLQEKSIYRRIAHKVHHLTRPVLSTGLPLKTNLLYLSRFLFKGIFLGGPKRMYYFFKSLFLGFKNPKVLSMIVSDWIVAVSLQSFAKRHFLKPVSLGERAHQYFQQSLVQKICHRVHAEILLSITQWQGIEKVQIRLKNPLDRREFKILSKSLKGYLHQCQGYIALDLREVKETGVAHLQVLLSRLKKYGNQIHLTLTEGTYQRLRQELSVFQFTLVAVGN